MATNSDNTAATEEQVEALIHGPQYSATQAEKDAALAPILRALCRKMAEQCPTYQRFLTSCDPRAGEWQATADIPPLPVSMFKHFLLSAVPPEKVVRELRSSATTGQEPSRILIDKTTAFRQSRALVSILKEHIGTARRPFLVLDAADAIAQGDSLTARGAAIRGIGTFAANTVFAMDRDPSGDLVPNWERIESFFATHHGKPLLLFGFTFVVWTRFVLEAERRGLVADASEAVLLHSGGWKKLTAQAVSKEEFTGRTAAVLGNASDRILDFYGMVEQVGTVFVDCAAGNKHAPAFADVILRRPGSLMPAEVGQSGIIEVVSVLPTSYPGHVLLTEDQGILIGVDDCPCGRKGRYFRFTSRIERAEIRGCGDTFAKTRETQ